MKSLNDLDLYKVIILISLVALPCVGFWAYHLQGSLEEGRRALAKATGSGGDIEEIGTYEREIEEQRKNSVEQQDAAETPDVYFDRCIRRSDKSGNIRRTDFTPHKVGETRVGAAHAVDTAYRLEFKRDGEKMKLTREFILAVLFNIEANSRLWKLRELSMRNASLGRNTAANKAPPPELADEWEIQRLEFASRRPLGAEK